MGFGLPHAQRPFTRAQRSAHANANAFARAYMRAHRAGSHLAARAARFAVLRVTSEHRGSPETLPVLLFDVNDL